ncbi:rab proteins geranylgeranyltransferase component A 1 [Anthonomus grandis grandis]|uniref:rab proteins geranylgeranyltransferase component A 1 n=1 Tax=Anthonomus grandis grandis TaxID=2921223 RepID=UPI00216564D1|nr:rab proteins geranylgeranyltransferase component A 1 [Anthonomus grandis grandis]
MDQKLPSNFDLIIIGTGFIESVISAAASRIGKSVLHLDENDFYGGQWASFNLEALKTSPPIHIQDFESNFWTEDSESLLKNSRKFNIDLVPKVHYARGDFVELLISSNIARYTEFRSVSRILTSLNGQLELVPCSRSDVFANNKVSVIEKRMLMKLLTSLDEEVVISDPNQTFKEFLTSKKLSDNLVHFVLYAMARSTDVTPVSEGIENTKRFLQSLGRFGKTPFLFSMYGSGDTPQAFCRLSAVFGGTFALDMPHSLKIENNRVEALVLKDQEVSGQHFVLGEAEFRKVNNKGGISRAVFITDKSVLSSESEHLTLLVYPPEKDIGLVTVLELGSLTGTCPKDVYLVHMSCKQITKPKEDFAHVVACLFTEDEGSPKVLWSSYFTLPESSNDLMSDEFKEFPENVFLCPGPDVDLDYDSSIKKAKMIFESLYPGEEFLPRAPDPEEIIIGEECVQGSVDFKEQEDGVTEKEAAPSGDF